jgi:hypothetical protein
VGSYWILQLVAEDVEWLLERMELGVNTEEEDVTIPPHLLPVAPVVNHFQDFVLLVGFAEDEGPKPLV